MILRQNKKSIALYILLVFVVLVSFYSYSTASVNSYPTQGWQISSPEEQGMRSQMLADMMEVIKKNSYDIDSVLIIRNGYMVLDAYFYPFLKGQQHIIHSCTKSIMSALIGIAIDKGYIKNINQPITDFFPDKAFSNADDLKKSITLENMLMMASGLKCRDSYRYRSLGLFKMINSNDWAQYVLDLPMAEAPGDKFEYCNGVSYLLSVIIQNTTKMKTLDFAKKHLFEPLGIIDIGWPASPQGFNIGYGEMWLKPPDMAKIGWLYLNKGRWGRKQILPSAWVEVSTRGHIGATMFDQYGYQWWVDSAGFYAAVGRKGQFIFVVPEKNMVAVFTSDLQDSDFFVPRKLLEKYILPAVVSTNALPLNKEEKVRLDELVISVAKPKGFTWTSEKEGIAKSGVFKRTATPSFQFEYPLGSKKAVRTTPVQIMRMKTPDDVPFAAGVVDVPEGLEIEDFGPIGYVAQLKKLGSNIKVISNKEITLKCGTKAYRTDITWLVNNIIPIKTFLVSVYMEGKCILVSAHPWKNHDKVELIAQSLTFK